MSKDKGRVRIAHLNYSDSIGGAARASRRIHQALLSVGVDSRMWVVKNVEGDSSTLCPTDSMFKLGTIFRPHAAKKFENFFSGKKQGLSTSIFPSRWPQLINSSNDDIAHLHWVCSEMMSIEDIGRIRKPIVWTLHDMWAFCGSEHVASNEDWKTGYKNNNKDKIICGLDLDRWTWKRKFEAWKLPIQIVTPSRWLADCVRNSELMNKWSVTTIPNPINTDLWSPIEKNQARQILGLSVTSNIVLFGAIGGGQVGYKGFDLLQGALLSLKERLVNLEILIFGQNKQPDSPDLGFPTTYYGHLYDEISLRLLYCAADVLVIPSRVDNFPNTGVEAAACGTPIAAFDTCGLSDIITHEKNGWLAKPFDIEDLAKGISWILEDQARQSRLGKAARDMAVDHFSYRKIAAQYEALYEQVINSFKGAGESLAK